MPTSPAQQNFRDYKKEIHQMTKFIVAAIRAGEFYTMALIDNFYAPLLEMYEDEVYSNGYDEERWIPRGVDLKDAEVNAIASYYNLPDFIPDEQEPEPEDTNPIEELFGYDVITASYGESRGGVVRGQILLTLEELQEYLAPIPEQYVIGIVIIGDNKNRIVGYSVCVGKK